MASTVLGTAGSAYARPARPASGTAASTGGRRPPASALGAGLLALLEAVGLLATGLTRVDAVLTAPVRPAGSLVVLGLLVLAGWIVLTAGAGAALVEGSGRRLVVLTSVAELGVLPVLGVVALAVPPPEALTGGVPLPLLFAAALAVPVGKLLLADAPSAREWVLQGPRVQVRRPDPVTRHPSLCTVTLGLIALALGSLALLGPVEAGPSGPVTSVVSQR